MVCERANRRRNHCDASADEYEKLANVASLNNTVQRSDFFPAGYHATELANVQPGDSKVIYGAGPVEPYGSALCKH
jgi:threonine dehydrogenase-like Zn-dependent dehydrogenase